MTRIWLHEIAVKGSENWRGFWSNVSYDEALKKVRKDNREERKTGHLMRFRIRELILDERIKEVK